jgi:hypothetical protein
MLVPHLANMILNCKGEEVWIHFSFPRRAPQTIPWTCILGTIFSQYRLLL